MDPSRKRKVRFVVALSVAVLLAGALVYTSFSASSEARTPSQLLAGAEAGRGLRAHRQGRARLRRARARRTYFRVRDRAGTGSVPVRYTGRCPDPFREGREVIVDVRKQGDGFVGEKDSLITKCPSKFTAEQNRPDAWRTC